MLKRKRRKGAYPSVPHLQLFAFDLRTPIGIGNRLGLYSDHCGFLAERSKSIIILGTP